MFQCNENELKRLRLSHTTNSIKSKRLSDNDWSPKYEKNLIWKRQSGEKEGNKGKEGKEERRRKEEGDYKKKSGEEDEEHDIDSEEEEAAYNRDQDSMYQVR